jgi:acetyl-CoA carboxylase biotin carboxyl carrier protein
MADKPEREIDEDLVHQLTRLLDETGLTEIEYGRDGWHIRVAKGGIAVSTAVPDVGKLRRYR